MQEDARAAGRPGLGSGRGRPRPGDEHHARAWHPGRAPRQNPGDDETRQGHGRRPDLVDRRFEACAPNRLHVADITYVRMANGSFGYTAFAADVYARRIVGWACATTMNTQELPLQALEQAVSWAASRGGADGLIHHSD